MNPETLYNHYSNAIIGAVGKDATTAQQLNTLGNALMPGFYRGAHPRGQEPVDDNTKHVYVVCIINPQMRCVYTSHDT